jgi:hypothetical protein
MVESTGEMNARFTCHLDNIAEPVNFYPCPHMTYSVLGKGKKLAIIIKRL